MPTLLEQSIVKTIVYFDGFSFPLTSMEIWKWMINDSGTTYSLRDVVTALTESAWLRERCATKKGMYHLRGREETIRIRDERYLIAERKFQRVRRAVRAFRFLPFIRGIAVCNTLAYANARDESDIDLLIIARPGRIWAARMFATGMTTLFRWRPTHHTSRDTLCLSFYLADSRTSLHEIARGQQDLYLRYWIDQLVCVYGNASAFNELRNANIWVRGVLPHSFGTAPSPRRITHDSVLSSMVKRMLELVHTGSLGDVFERLYRTWQVRHLPARLRSLMNRDPGVVVNDRMLKFHENDRRDFFTQRYTEQLHQLHLS